MCAKKTTVVLGKTWRAALVVIWLMSLTACNSAKDLKDLVDDALEEEADDTVSEITVAAPASVISGKAGYAASVTAQDGATYAWTLENGTLMIGADSHCVVFQAGDAGTAVLSCTVTDEEGGKSQGRVSIPVEAAGEPEFNISQCLSDNAQGTTIAFSGFGMMTGNLGAQSFFPPGKVADYWGFQCLRDNDADRMGHNTSFLTRVACNMLYILNDSQIARLKSLAESQVEDINLYAWKRYPLMAAFRRLMDGDLPQGTTELDIAGVVSASRELYILDGRISYDRAVVYGDIYRSFTADQKNYISNNMVGKSFSSWPVIDEDDVRDKMKGLTHDVMVAMMTYAGDLYSWYAGSITADVYFCPERHGTYFGSFYIKDAPAIGHAGYSIDEKLTGDVGKALCDSTLGYISAAGAARMNALVTTQKANLYADDAANMVLARTNISKALRELISSTAPSQAELDRIWSVVETWSGVYGERDGENVYQYAVVFSDLFNNTNGTYITDAQKTMLSDLRKDIMTVSYDGGATFYDFSTCGMSFLFASEIPADSADLADYTGDAATGLFFK